MWNDLFRLFEFWLRNLRGGGGGGLAGISLAHRESEYLVVTEKKRREDFSIM